MTVTTESIPLTWIRRDGGTQVRAYLDAATVENYRELYAGDDCPLPAPLVFHDGQSYWLADGFQRCEAAEQAGLRELNCEVRVGTQRDAKLIACGANAEHGLPRSSQDKRRAVETLLADEEWGKKSTNWICEQAKVSHTFAIKVRAEWEKANGPKETRIGKDGVERKSTREKPTELLAREVEPGQMPEPSQAEPESPVLQMPDEPVFDVFGAPVPPEVIPAWMTGKELRAAATQIAKIKSSVEKLSRADGGQVIHFQTVQKALDQASETIRRSSFYVVCPECEGLGNDCNTCKKRWLSESQFSQLSPSQKKKCERHQRKRA